jgi:hypothetical protein
VPIPLFLLMGEIFFQTGLGSRMFNAIDKLLGKLPGSAELRHRARRDRVFDAVRVVDGIDCAARLADGAGDEPRAATRPT